MTKHDKADQARKGLMDSVKGKAKELAGAVTGNDSLTAEGQLEQAQARERKEANSVEAVADAEAEQARGETADARRESTLERAELHAETAALEDSIQVQQAAQKRSAETVGAEEAATAEAQAELVAQREMEQAKTQERVDIRAAADEAYRAVTERQAVEDIAENVHEEADRIRARAARLTNEAGLP